MWVDCKCIEFVTAGCCVRKWFRFDQTITNLTSGGLGIPLVLIRLRLPTCAYSIRLFDGRKENVTSACGTSSDDWANSGHGSGNEVDSLVVSVALVLWRVGPILRNRYGI